MTSFNPSRKRIFNDRRNAYLKPSFSLSLSSKPRTSPAAVGGRGDRNDDGLEQDPVIAPCSLSRRGNVREVLRREGSVAELGDVCVQARADTGHL